MAPYSNTRVAVAEDFGWTDPCVRTGVMVKAGLHEVDLKFAECAPCYWKGPAHRVLRATWFAMRSGEWIPLGEKVADALEGSIIRHIPARRNLALDLKRHEHTRCHCCGVR
jgi:hypothetical protein